MCDDGVYLYIRLIYVLYIYIYKHVWVHDSHVHTLHIYINNIPYSRRVWTWGRGGMPGNTTSPLVMKSHRFSRKRAERGGVRV